MKKPISLLLCILIAACLFVPVYAAEGGPAETTNYGGQNYDRWAVPVNSYLFENPSGGLTRVEYADGKVIVEHYDDTFNYSSGETLAMELPIWGGFFAGQEYNYLVEGQNNEEQDDAREVIRIIQYDKDWKRIGSTGLYGANTVHPFAAGSARFAEYADDLYIRTCHEMYAAADGYNHQASVTIAVKQSELKVTDSWYEVMNVGYGYVSHSFNQFVIVDGEQNIVCADHGDANPRSTVLIRYPTKAGNGVFSADYIHQVSFVNVQEYPGYRGDNTTGGTLGGTPRAAGGTPSSLIIMCRLSSKLCCLFKALSGFSSNNSLRLESPEWILPFHGRISSQHVFQHLESDSVFQSSNGPRTEPMFQATPRPLLV